MITEYTKDGKLVYAFDILSYGKYKHSDLIKQNYIEVFDNRNLFYNNTLTGGSLIISNITSGWAKEFQDSLFTKTHKSKHETIECNNIDNINLILSKKYIKNIILDMDNISSDLLRMMIKAVFSNYINLNIFIKSNNILNIIQDELDNHMNDYSIINPYYTHGSDSKPYFNELVFTLLKNNLYEFIPESNFIKELACNIGYDKCEINYKKEYLYIYGNYDVDWSHM